MNNDEARWADAHALLDESPSDADLARLRHRVRISWLIVGPLLIAALGARVATADNARARTLIGAAFLVLVAILIIVGLVVSARSSVERSGDYPLSALERHQRRLLLREVQGRAAADPTHLDLTRHLAHRQSLPTPSVPFAFGWLVLTIMAALLGRSSRVRIAVLAVAAAFFLGLLIFGAVQGRRARRFLVEHPASPDATGDER